MLNNVFGIRGSIFHVPVLPSGLFGNLVAIQQGIFIKFIYYYYLIIIFECYAAAHTTHFFM